MAGQSLFYLWGSFWCFCLGFLLAMVIIRHNPGVNAEPPMWPAETLENFPPLTEPEAGGEPMMVVSLDGGLHAIHPVSRKTLWSFESGSKLATAYYANRRKESKESRDSNASMDVPRDEDLAGDTGGPGEEWTVFPGPDGSLYVHDENGITPLRVTVKQLVENSPHHTDDGSVVLSTVTSTAFLLNKDTGALIRKFDNSGTTLKRAASLVTGSANPEDAEILLGAASSPNSSSDEKIPTLLCLRTDYAVTVHELTTGAVKWNISLGEVKTLPLVGPGFPGRQFFSEKSNSDEKGLIARPIPGTSMNFPKTLPSSAPIAIFSPTGEYVENLIPDFESRKGSRQMLPGLASPQGTKPSDMHNNIHPILDDADHKQLVPVLSDVGKAFYSREEFPEGQWQPFDGQKKPINESVTRGGPLLQAEGLKYLSRTILWKTLLIGVVMLISGLASAMWYFSKYGISQFYIKKKEEETIKVKKSGANKGRKKGRKGSVAVSGHLVNGSNGETGNENLNAKQAGSKTRDDPVEVLGRRRLALDTSGYGEGIQIGRLFVTKVVIGAGSNGTTVFEGYLDGRNVAVKRLLAHYYDKAEKEIKFLITSDEHPNVVRYFAMEETSDFVYVALERCSLNLSDLILLQTIESPFHNTSVENVDIKDLKQLKLPNGKELKLWDENGRCTPQLLQLMRDIAAGLAHLHSVGIVHRDLKPHNVLVSCSRIIQAKLADMGLSKHLDKDVSSYQDTGKGGSGSRGWQAPEQLTEGRQTRAVDIFSLGCVLFFCITGGQHPYGEHYLRDANIAKGCPDLFFIDDMPEAHHLIQALLSHNPSKRPMARDVVLHPLFWNPEERLSFLRDASDRVELEDREENSVVLSSIEAIGPMAFGASWDTNLDTDLLDNLRRYRRYNFSSVRDLLRIIRNKSNHYRELPQDLQELLGPVPEGYESYFSARFPRLVIEVYKVLYDHCKEERMFKRYFAHKDE